MILVWHFFEGKLVPFWNEPCEAMNAAAADLNAAQVRNEKNISMKQHSTVNHRFRWTPFVVFLCVQESLNACLKRQRSLIQLWAVVNVCGWVLKVLLVVHTNSSCTYSVDFSMLSFALHIVSSYFFVLFLSLWTRPDWRELWARITLPRQPNTTCIHRCWCSCPWKVVSVLVQCRLDSSSHNEGFKQ